MTFSAPTGILPGQSEDDRHGAGWDAGPSRSVGLSPLPADQVPVPAEQGLGLHEEPSPTPAVEQSAQPGEQGTIRGPQGRADDLTPKHCDLVAEHDDLDRQIVAIAVTKAHQLEDPGEGEVEKREGHGLVSSSSAISGKPWSSHLDDILGTHRWHRRARRRREAGSVGVEVCCIGPVHCSGGPVSARMHTPSRPCRWPCRTSDPRTTVPRTPGPRCRR